MRPIVNLPEEDRATDIGNMHKNLVKVARVVLEISCRTDRQTDKQTHSSLYFVFVIKTAIKNGLTEMLADGTQNMLFKPHDRTLYTQ